MTLNWTVLQSSLGALDNVSISYVDDEGDTIPIKSECELREALKFAKTCGNNKLSLTVNINNLEMVENNCFNFNGKTHADLDGKCGINIKEEMSLPLKRVDNTATNTPPKWFNLYSHKLRNDLLHKVKKSIQQTVQEALKTKLEEAFSCPRCKFFAPPCKKNSKEIILNEIKNDIRKELKKDIKSEIKSELKRKVRNNIKIKINNDSMCEVKNQKKTNKKSSKKNCTTSQSEADECYTKCIKQNMTSPRTEKKSKTKCDKLVRKQEGYKLKRSETITKLHCEEESNKKENILVNNWTSLSENESNDTKGHNKSIPDEKNRQEIEKVFPIIDTSQELTSFFRSWTSPVSQSGSGILSKCHSFPTTEILRQSIQSEGDVQCKVLTSFVTGVQNSKHEELPDTLNDLTEIDFIINHQQLIEENIEEIEKKINDIDEIFSYSKVDKTVEESFEHSEN